MDYCPLEPIFANGRAADSFNDCFRQRDYLLLFTAAAKEIVKRNSFCAIFILRTPYSAAPKKSLEQNRSRLASISNFCE